MYGRIAGLLSDDSRPRRLCGHDVVTAGGCVGNVLQKRKKNRQTDTYISTWPWLMLLCYNRGALPKDKEKLTVRARRCFFPLPRTNGAEKKVAAAVAVVVVLSGYMFSEKIGDNND